MSPLAKSASYIRRGLRFIRARYMPRGARPSFAASGEDLIMFEALEKMGAKDTACSHYYSYIDIGAHHPIFGNNTCLFYHKGGRGVVVEPNPALCALARKKRSRDSIVNAGAGRADGSADFYAFPQSTRSTFSKEQALEWEKKSGQHPSVQTMPLLSLDSIVEKYFNDTARQNISDIRCPDIISIDAEGLDIEILSGFSWRCRPKIFCVESLSNRSAADPAGAVNGRNAALYDIFATHRYAPYAETSANTIFVDTMALNAFDKAL